jgi:hypothetical protein
MEDRERDSRNVGERHKVVFELLFACQLLQLLRRPIETYSAVPLNKLCLMIAQAFSAAPVARKTRKLARTAAALWSSRPGLSTSFSTCETEGVFRFKTFEREMMYLCRTWYSFADIVYRKALRRTGSVVDFAVNLSRDGFPPSWSGVAIATASGYSEYKRSDGIQ